MSIMAKHPFKRLRFPVLTSIVEGRARSADPLWRETAKPALTTSNLAWRIRAPYLHFPPITQTGGGKTSMLMLRPGTLDVPAAFPRNPSDASVTWWNAQSDERLPSNGRSSVFGLTCPSTLAAFANVGVSSNFMARVSMVQFMVTPRRTIVKKTVDGFHNSISS
jgi:hypothetical protein